MSSVVDGTVDVLSKALKRFAGEDKTFLVRPSDVIIIIGISDITVEEPTVQNPVKRALGEPFYRIIKQEKPYLRMQKIKAHPGQAETDEVSFLKLLDAKVDFFQYEPQSKPFLMGAFGRFTEELNADLLNNEEFKQFLESEVKTRGEGKEEAELKAIREEIIAENSYGPNDLEIWVVTPKRADIAGKPQDQDGPVIPVPFLYAKGEMVRQIDFAKDIFQMAE